jgi:hypothetical protein
MEATTYSGYLSEMDNQFQGRSPIETAQFSAALRCGLRGIGEMVRGRVPGQAVSRENPACPTIGSRWQ